MKIAYRGYLALAIMLLEISIWPILLQVGGSRIGILPELFYGFLVGSVVSLSVSLIKDRGRGMLSIVAKPNMLVIIVVAGLLNDALTQLFLGIGTLGTNPSIGAIVFRSWVVIAAVLAPVVLRQKVGKRQLMATLVGFLGIYVMLSNGTLFAFDPGNSMYVGMLLVAAICSALSALVMNQYNVDTAGAITIFNLSSFIVMSAAVLATHTSIAIAFTPKVLFSILFMGVVAYGIGTMLYYYSVKILGQLITGNFILTVPFMTMILSFALLGTPIKAYYIVAAALTGAGVLLQRRYSVLREHIPRNKALEKTRIFDFTGVFAANSGKIGKRIAEGDRVFAIRIYTKRLNRSRYLHAFEKRKCIVFTNKDPYVDVRSEEMEFISEVMKLGRGVALIGVGSAPSLEDSLGEFCAAYGK